MKKKIIRLLFKNKQNSSIFIYKSSLVKALDKSFYYSKEKHRSLYKAYNSNYIDISITGLSFIYSNQLF